MANNFKDKKVLNHERGEGSRFSGTKVLIFGLGINQGGVGSAKFFALQGANVKVTDLKTKDQLQSSLDQLKDYTNIEYILGEHRYEDFDWADLIIKNQAIKPDNIYLSYAKEKGKLIEMDLGIFLEYVKPSQIIGVTGTKGKSTTASLIYETLKDQDNVIFAGNIGKSVLDSVLFVKENTVVVLELSSFQLEAFDQHRVSPHISVITNIFPDHLNYYSSMEQYIEAKKVIAKYQTPQDLLFLQKDDPITTNPEFLKNLHGNINYFSTDQLPVGFKPRLLGEHNLLNCAAAFAVAAKMQIPQEKAVKALSNFQGIEFRMQLIKEINGIKIYNDTAATDPDAAMKSLISFPNCILIAGGVNKNLPYEELANTIEQYAKSVYFLEGDASEIIKSNLKTKKPKGTYNNFESILLEIKKEAKSGDIILFSPGAASFNLFQNEFDRGRKFNEAVEKIFS